MAKSSRPSHALAEKSHWLLEDAKQMEARLADLRLHMDKEQRERLQRLESGRVWASSDAPRTRLSKQQISGRGNVSLDSSLRESAVARSRALASVTREHGRLAHDVHQVRNKGVTRRKDAAQLPHEESDDKERCGSLQKCSRSLAHGTFDEEESRLSFLAALDAWRVKARPEVSVPALNAASATDSILSDRPGTLPVEERGISMFRRMLLIKALHEAGAAAAAESSCRNSSCRRQARESEPLDSPLPSKLQLEKPCTSDAAPSLDTQHHAPQSAGMLDDGQWVEDIRIVSVTDVNQCDALTSGTRLPDTIILPD